MCKSVFRCKILELLTAELTSIIREEDIWNSISGECTFDVRYIVFLLDKLSSLCTSGHLE